MFRVVETKRIIIIRVLCSIVFIAVMIYASEILSMKSMHGSIQCISMYAQPRNTVDVVMIGSSHIHCDINPAILWEEQGIAAYDFSAAEQPMWITYYYLKEFCKYQDPKVVVLDLYSPAKYKDSFDPAWIGENIYNIKPSINKIRMVASACTLEQINEFFPSFFGYHSRYEDLSEVDFDLVLHHEKQKDFKGFTPFYKVVKGKKPADNVTERGDIPERSMEYLNKIIDYTEENDIRLFLVVNPYPSTPDQEMMYNSIQDLAEQRGVQFKNFNHESAEIGIDYESDFNDDSHLNYEGSCKFSSYLGTTLKELFDIPDRRGFGEEYSSWDRNVRNDEGSEWYYK